MPEHAVATKIERTHNHKDCGPTVQLTEGARLRSFVIFVPLLAMMIALCFRLVHIQVTEAHKWQQAAERQRISKVRVPAPRGPIRGINNELMVQSIRRPIVFADLHILKDKALAAQQLAPILEIPAEGLFERMNRDDRRVVYLKRNVDKGVAERIEALKIRGIGLEEAYRRNYPMGPLGCHILGWAGPDGGMEGLELQLNSLLMGIPGYRFSERDAARRPIMRDADRAPLPRDCTAQQGLQLTLTIHPGIQHFAEVQLAEIMQKFSPKGASCVVMDVRTGMLLAMANLPDYDPNTPAEVPPDNRRNRVLTDVYEPGSTFKTFTTAYALERNEVERSTRIFCENGSWRFGYRTLHDAHAYATLTLDETIIYSSNIASAKIGLKLGIDGVFDAVSLFGFGEKTGVDLPGEARGLVRPKPRWTRDSLLSVPMGQEIAVTPLQLVTAYTALVNGGVLFKPQLVKEIRSSEDQLVFQMAPQTVRRAISAKTSKAMREMLARVVIEGTGRNAWCEEYAIGGKTGTAQKVINGTYSNERYVGSFCGFAPVEDPHLVCLITVDEPDKRKGYYGGTVAGAAVKEVLRRSLNALGVPPRNEEERQLAKKQREEAQRRSR